MGDGIMSVITAFQNTDYVFNEIMASFGFSDSMEEKCMDEATEQLLMQIVQDGNYAKTMVELFDVGVNTWDMLQKGANLLEATEYVELPSGKKAAIGKAVEGQSEIFDMMDIVISVIREILTSMYVTLVS